MNKHTVELGVVPLEQEAFNHYQKNTMSIEILKDDSLQKINFRVKNKVRVRSVNTRIYLLTYLPLYIVSCREGGGMSQGNCPGRNARSPSWPPARYRFGFFSFIVYNVVIGICDHCNNYKLVSIMGGSIAERLACWTRAQ